MLSELGSSANAYSSQATNQVALTDALALYYLADLSGRSNPTEDGPVIGARYYLSYAQTAPSSNCSAYGLLI